MSLEQYEVAYHRGFFSKRDDVQLINGYVVTRMAESPLHCPVLEMVRIAIGAILLATWHTRSQSGLKIPVQTSIPRPTWPWWRGGPSDYQAQYPEPADTVLVAEVSIQSLAEDRVLAMTYGKAGIPAYWLINVDDGQVEVYSNPGPSGYQSHEVLAPGHMLSLVIDGVEVGEIAVADILPR